MGIWKQEVLLLVLCVVGFFSLSTYGQRPRRLGERVLAAQDIPLTNFSCVDRSPGYYADVETGCQVYHMCTDGGQQFSYRCPNTTLFQQRMLICAHWYQVNCSRSEQDYNANLLIGQRDKPFVDESEHINIYFNNEEDSHSLRNPDDLQRLGTNGNGGGRVFNHPFIRNTIPDTFNIPPRLNATSIFHTTNPIDLTFRSIVPTHSPTTFKVLPTTPPISMTSSFVPFSTYFTTTQFPQTETNFDQDYETTTNDYFDESINNSYNNFINRFIPDLNETDSNISHTVTAGSVSTFNDNTVTDNPVVQSTTVQPVTFAFNTKYTSTNSVNDRKNNNGDNSNNERNLYNNFITRFIPDINETNVQTDTFTQIEHRFLKRFNPDEGVPNANTNHHDQFNPQTSPHFMKPNLFTNNQNLGNFDSLIPPFKEPSVNLELPQEVEDTDHMESNILELRFQDPRQIFFIPENEHQNIPIENVTPITVNIPRQLAQQQLHPMLFVNSVPDICNRCHSSFIVNKATCSPCVVIR